MIISDQSRLPALQALADKLAKRFKVPRVPVRWHECPPALDGPMAVFVMGCETTYGITQTPRKGKYADLEHVTIWLNPKRTKIARDEDVLWHEFGHHVQLARHAPLTAENGHALGHDPEHYQILVQILTYVGQDPKTYSWAAEHPVGQEFARERGWL
jgi:hypothetical protein